MTSVSLLEGKTTGLFTEPGNHGWNDPTIKGKHILQLQSRLLKDILIKTGNTSFSQKIVKDIFLTLRELKTGNVMSYFYPAHDDLYCSKSTNWRWTPERNSRRADSGFQMGDFWTKGRRMLLHPRFSLLCSGGSFRTNVFVSLLTCGCTFSSPQK